MRRCMVLLAAILLAQAQAPVPSAHQAPPAAMLGPVGSMYDGDNAKLPVLTRTPPPPVADAGTVTGSGAGGASAGTNLGGEH